MLRGWFGGAAVAVAVALGGSAAAVQPTPPAPAMCRQPDVTCTYDGYAWVVDPTGLHSHPVDHGPAVGGPPFVLLLVFAGFALFLGVVNLASRLSRRTSRTARQS